MLKHGKHSSINMFAMSGKSIPPTLWKKTLRIRFQEYQYNKQASLGCPIHRLSCTNNSNNKTNFVHVFPSDIKPRFLKNLPHSRVRFWPCHHLGNGCRNKTKQPTNIFAMLGKSIPPTLWKKSPWTTASPVTTTKMFVYSLRLAYALHCWSFQDTTLGCWSFQDPTLWNLFALTLLRPKNPWKQIKTLTRNHFLSCIGSLQEICCVNLELLA